MPIIIGQTATRTLSITNEENYNLAIKLAVEDEQDVFGFLVEGQKVRTVFLALAPNETIVLTVCFTPNAAQRFEGQINIYAMPKESAISLTACGTE